MTNVPADTMITEHVSLFSQGSRIEALWRTSANVTGPYRAIVQGPGWLGTKDAELYVPYHRALTAAGFGVLIIDYRGFATNDAPEDLTLSGQVQDLRNAVSYLVSRDDVSPGAIGAIGIGATGGGNVILLGATDRRIRCIVNQFPVADGRDWLRGLRGANEWREFLEKLQEDRVHRVLTGTGRMVDPAVEITVPNAERAAAGIKKDIAAAVPTKVSLSLADEVLEYRPLDVMHRVEAPTLFIAVENDLVTPESHSKWLYKAARCKKRLIMQRATTHYASYARYGDLITSQIVEWFDQNLSSNPFIEMGESER